MTRSNAAEVARHNEPVELAPSTFTDDLQRMLRNMLVRSTLVHFPSTKYQRDPVRFFREVLGVEPWSRQVEIINAVRDHQRVAICSGHKIGKSACIAGLALWYYCSFIDARVIMSSTTSRQVDQILWRELRMMRARSGRCVECKRADPDGFVIPRPCPHSALIDGEQGELARTGLKSVDFREIFGFTAREPEAMAGISGRNLLYLIDEASGVPDEIFEALEGNRAGGARIVLMSNGTRNEGEFFEAFTSKLELYFTLRISSEETPNVVRDEEVIPGLATRAWIEEKKREWGPDSPLYLVRVKGQHATNEEGRIFSLARIAEAEQRWYDTPEVGRLFIGIDPAGESGSGDETVFCVRRGLKMLSLTPYLGLSAEMHLVYLLAMLKRPLLLPRERAVVVIDGDGSVGSRLAGAMRNYLDEHDGAFELIVVRGGERPKGEKARRVYAHQRDQLAGNFDDWLKEGGTLLEDTKLERELHALEWHESPQNAKLSVTSKPELRKLLGRSPDRYDAAALSVWEPASLRDDVPLPPSAPRSHARTLEPELHAVPTLDPYAGGGVWGKP